MRLRRVAVALVLAAFAAVPAVGLADPAYAAASITIDSPRNGATVVATNDEFAASGTYVPLAGEGDFDSIRAVVDGTILRGFNERTHKIEAGSYYVAQTQGDHWSFTLLPFQFRGIGLVYPGKHTVQFQVVRASGKGFLASTSPITITIVVPPPTESGLASAPDAASFLSSLTTAQSLGLTPARGIGTAALTVVLMLLVGFPGQLLGSTLSANYERIFGWTRPLQRRFRTLTNRVERFPNWAVVAIGVTLSSIISGFIDPQFGFNPGSLRVLLEVAAAFLVQSLLGWYVVGRIVRRTEPTLKPVIEFKVLSLLFVIVAVVISRLTGFEPGIVFGLIVGLNFGARLTATRKARIALTGSGYAFVVAIIGWIGYSIATSAFGASPGLLGVFIIETLSGFTVAGIATLPIALLPIRALEGGEIYEWKRWVWALAYGIGMFAFLLILLPLPFSWGTVHLSLIVWIAIYVGYGLAAVGVWAFFRYYKPRRTGTGSTKEVLESEPEVAKSD